MLETRLAHMRRHLPGDESAVMEAVRIRYDNVLSMHGERASPPILGETIEAYRRRLLIKVLPFTARFANERCDSLQAYLLEPVENEALTEARQRAVDRRNATAGVLVPSTERVGGRDITRFQGDIGAFMAPFVDPGATVRLVKGNSR